jgi:hypothetical protein
LEKQFGIVIPTLELTDTTNVAKLARRIIDHSGIGNRPGRNNGRPVSDPDQLELSAESELVAALGRPWKMISIERRNASFDQSCGGTAQVLFV